jgi:hypothetical protein
MQFVLSEGNIFDPMIMSWEPNLNDHEDANPPILLEDPHPWGWWNPVEEVNQVTRVIAF